MNVEPIRPEVKLRYDKSADLVFPDTLDLNDDFTEVMGVLSKEIRQLERSGMTLTAIARKSGLSRGQISKASFNEYKRPHYKVVLSLLVFFGWKVRASKSR